MKTRAKKVTTTAEVEAEAVRTALENHVDLEEGVLCDNCFQPANYDDMKRLEGGIRWCVACVAAEGET